MNLDEDKGIVHQASTPMGGVQKCGRCGYVLAQQPFMFWADGPVTVWEGNPTQYVAGTHSVRECGERGN